MKYIAIDLGTKTMGIAVSNNGIIASPKETYYFKENDFASALIYLTSLIKQEKFDILVVGYPKNMNNTIGSRANMINNFVTRLKKQLSDNIKIELQDERLTTKMANSLMLEANLSRQKRKINKDTLAAQIILMIYLEKKGSF